MNKTITVLVDNESWILPYAEKLVKELVTLGYQAQLARNNDAIVNGWINFMLGCVKITPNNILERNHHNLVIHESDLPQGKGFAPMSWQILEGSKEIPICLIEASEEVDGGNIWMKDTIQLDGTELNEEWRKKQAIKTIELCLSFVQNYSHVKAEKQSGSSSFYKRRAPQDSELDIEKSIIEQFNLLRIVNNESYPAFFYFDNIKYIIKIDRG